MLWASAGWAVFGMVVRLALPGMSSSRWAVGMLVISSIARPAHGALVSS